MFSTKILFIVYVFATNVYENVAMPQYYNQNNTVTLPYPYPIPVALPTRQTMGIPSQLPLGIPLYGAPLPYTYPRYQQPSAESPNATKDLNNYYALLTQQGIPAYQYPEGESLGYTQPGLGYPQPGGRYPLPGVGYPQVAFGYPQTYVPYTGYPHGGFGYPYSYNLPGVGYPSKSQGTTQQDSEQPQLGQGALQLGYGYPLVNQGPMQQPYYGYPGNNYANIKTEIIDVSPEYQRQLLGWTSEGNGDISANAPNGPRQETKSMRSKYNVQVDSQTSNITDIPKNLTRPIVTSKQFTTSIRRTFVYDSSKPGEIKPVNIHFINGEPVTTTPAPTTTESENVEDYNKGVVTPKGRRFMDVPKSCPRGSLIAHNGECIESFMAASFALKKPNNDEITTKAPPADKLVNKNENALSDNLILDF